MDEQLTLWTTVEGDVPEGDTDDDNGGDDEE